MKKAVCGFVLMVVVAVASYGADATSLLLWDDVTDRGGQDEAQAVAVSGNTAVVAQVLSAPGAAFDFSVKAYDVNTGQVRWEDHMPATLPGARPDYLVGAVYVATLGDSAYAAVYVPTGTLVRAYRAATGDVLWSHYWDGVFRPSGITAIGALVTVVGVTQLRMLDAATGDVLSTTPMAADTIMAFASDGAQTITAGRIRVDGRSDMILRARNAQTGAVIWERSPRERTTVVRMKIVGSRIFVGGQSNLDGLGGVRAFLAAYDVFTGSLLWQMPEVSDAGWFNDLDANSTQVVAVNPVTGWIQSFNPATGAPRWSRKTGMVGASGEWFRRVFLTDSAAYAGGYTSIYQGQGPNDMFVEAYSPTGAILFNDRSHTSNNFDEYSGATVLDLAVSGQRLVTAGFARSGTHNAVVRGYNVASIEPAAPTVPAFITTFVPPQAIMGRVLIGRLSAITPLLLPAPSPVKSAGKMSIGR